MAIEIDLHVSFDALAEKFSLEKHDLICIIKKKGWLEDDGDLPKPTSLGYSKGLRRYGFFEDRAVFDLYVTQELYLKMTQKDK